MTGPPSTPRTDHPFRLFADACEDAVFLVDVAGVVLDANTRARACWGLGNEGPPSLPLAELLPTPTQARRRDGTCFPVEVRSNLPVEEGTRQVVVRMADRVVDTQPQRFLDVVNAVDGIVWEADAATFTFTFVSQQAERLLGYPLVDWLQPGFWAAHLHPDDRDWATRHCVDCTRRLEPHDFEYRFQARDGRVVWLRDIVRVVVEEGRPRWLRGVMFDVSAAKQAETSLRERETRTRQLIDTALDAVVTIDATGRINGWNPQARAVFGWNAHEVTGKLLSDLIIPPALRHAHDQGLRDYLSSGVVHLMDRHLELTAVRRSGEEFPVELAVTAFTVQGETQFGAFIRDLTERKRAEAAMRERDERVSQLAEQNRTVVWEVDADGLYTYVDRVAESVLGFPPEDLVGRKHFYDIHPDEGREAFKREALQTFARKERFRNLENPVRTRDGREVWVSTNGMPILLPDGTLSGYRGSDTDITERKRAEAEQARLQAQLRQSQKMEAIGGLAGGVAHDFNNLLSVILGNVGFAIKQAGEDSDLRADLLSIQSAAKRAASLTRQLLAFGRKQVLRPAALDLNQVTTGLEKMLGRIIGEDINLACVLAPDLGLTMADPSQVEQVVMNLVVNARDAMPGGGRLTIETANVDVDEELASRDVALKPGPYVRLSVVDTGSGMDEQTQARVFEPFFTTKPVGKGTGLGLSTVYGIVQQSGGTTWVRSKPGQGSTFSVLLPRIVPPSSPSTASPNAPLPGANSETVLVVEDEKSVVELVKRILAGAGYTVLTAPNGSEALRVCASHPGRIHLVLTDVVMPLMNGKELAERLAQVRPDLKVLFMSGYAEDGSSPGTALDATAEFIEKPFGVADLVRKVREVLDRDGPPPPDAPTGGE